MPMPMQAPAQGQTDHTAVMAEMAAMMDDMLQRMTALKEKMQSVTGGAPVEEGVEEQMAAGYAKARGPQVGA